MALWPVELPSWELRDGAFQYQLPPSESSLIAEALVYSATPRARKLVVSHLLRAISKLSRYAYTLGNAGNRTSVLELNSRNVAAYGNDDRRQSEAMYRRFESL